MLSFKKNNFILFPILFLSIFFVYSFLNPHLIFSAVDCCHHECKLTDPHKCEQNKVMVCSNCDSDHYYDWCEQTDCSKEGKICENGACKSIPAACNDNDKDGYGKPASNGCAHKELDCDDAKEFIHLGALETCDNYDNNCNGEIDEGCDDDKDGYCDKLISVYNSPVNMCSKTNVANGLKGNDCDDTKGEIHPGAVEICGNEKDEDCNGEDLICPLICTDSDKDGFGVCPNCGKDNGCVKDGDDCNDAKANIYPNAADICGNGVDEDCNGSDLACPKTCPDNVCDINAEECLSCAADCSCINAGDKGCDMQGKGYCCGNSITNIAAGEVCDVGTGNPSTMDLNGKTCASFGYIGGTLGCRWDCKNYDPSSCTGVPSACGDNKCDAGENCANCPTECCKCGDRICSAVVGENNNSCPEDCNNCVENWSCGGWSSCVNGIQIRECADANNCGKIITKPEEIQSCFSVKISNPKNGFKVAKDDLDINFSSIIFGGKDPYKYEWSDNGKIFDNNLPWQSVSPSVLEVGVHNISVKVIEGNSSSASDSIKIEILPQGSLNVQIQMWQKEFVRDNNMPITFWAAVSGGTPPYSFEWKSDKVGIFSAVNIPAVDISAWPLGDHIITLSVRDSMGKTASDSSEVKISEMMVRVNPEQGTYLEGEDIFFNAMPLGGEFPYSYKWVSDKDGDITPEINGDNFSKNNLSLGTHTITLTVSDSSSTPKQISKEIYITIKPASVLAVSISSPSEGMGFAQGDNISFQGSISGGVPPFIYKWNSNIDGNLNTDKDFSKNNLSVNNHIITFTVTDNAKKTASKTINLTITDPKPLSVSITSPENMKKFYQGESLIHFSSKVEGGVPPYTYRWSALQSGFLSDKSDFYISNLDRHDSEVVLRINDQAGNIKSVRVKITILAAPNFANDKNSSAYSAKETFLISHKKWQDVLSLIPISVWGGKNYPMLVYHEEDINIDIDSSIHFLQLYNPDHLTTVGALQAKVSPLLVANQPTGAGLGAQNISNINASDYFSYWNNINSIVVTGYENYQAGLMAAVFASYKNAPLIFIKEDNLETYKPLINGKIVYTVGDLDKAVKGYVKGNAGKEIDYTLKELQIWYSLKTNTDKAILVNSNDLNNDFTQPGPEPNNFSTEKGGTITQLLQRLSLASPYLAAAKQEVILFKEDADLSDINAIFKNVPKYITIMAGHDMVANEIKKDYPTTTRIAGISSTDIFSYSSRSIFYNELFEKLYPNQVYKKFYISADFSCSPAGIKDITNNIALVKFPHNPEDYPMSVLADKQFNVYYSHGNYSGWACNVFKGPTWLYCRDIPFLNLSWGSAGACSTGAFHGAVSFSYNWLRKGGMAYWGADRNILAGETNYGTIKPFEQLSANPKITLAELAKNIGGPYEMYGDPCLSLIYHGGNNSLPDIHLTVSETDNGGANEISINKGATAYMWCTGWDDGGGKINLWEIDFEGDGVYDKTASAGEHISHKYDDVNIYKPKCRATDDKGGQSITFAIIKVK